MGAFVDRINQRVVTVGSPYRLITDRIDTLRNYTNEWSDKLDNALNNLESGLGPYISHLQHISADIPNLDQPNMPTRPQLNTQLDTNYPADTLIDPNLQDIFIDLSISNQPVKPQAADADFSYTPGTYDSCLMSRVYQKACQALIDGGTGLTQVVYDAIIARNREARRNAQELAYRRAIDEVGSSGFKFSAGQAAAVLLEMQKEVLAKEMDAVNNTTIKDFEIADTNERFIKEWSIKVEELNRREFDSDEDRFFTVASKTKDYILAAYEQAVKIYIAEWDGIKAELSAKKLQVDAIVARNEAELKRFETEAQVLKIRFDAISDKNKNITELAKAEAAIFESEMRAVGIEFDALAKRVDIALQKYKTEVDAALGEEKLRLDAYTSQADLAAEMSKAVGRLAAQIVASALGGINASMGYSYTGHESRTASVSNNLSESHAYNEE
jgi:hypothetical protein